MNGGKGAPLLPLYDREAAAGRRLREQTFQQYCFWPCGAPASHLHHSVCSTLLCLKQRCRCTVYISESEKKNTRINYVCFGEGGGSTWCHQRRNFHSNRCVMRGCSWCIHKRKKNTFLVNKSPKSRPFIHYWVRAQIFWPGSDESTYSPKLTTDHFHVWYRMRNSRS